LPGPIALSHWTKHLQQASGILPYPTPQANADKKMVKIVHFLRRIFLPKTSTRRG
jgi:hypothetical protein